MKFLQVDFDRVRSIAIFLSVSLAIVAAAYVVIVMAFSNKPGMSDNWVGPYLSAAANLEIGGHFLIDEDEVQRFKEMDTAAQYKYRFRKSDHLTFYNHNPIGFAYFIRAATTIFPLGDMAAMICMHVALHLVICLSVLYQLTTNFKKFSFFFLYAVNPLVLYVVGINFYYVWQVVPAWFLLMIAFLPSGVEGAKKQAIYGVCAAACGVILGLVFVTRPTVLGHCLLILGVLGTRSGLRFKVGGPVVLAFLICVVTIQKPTEKNIWHTVYVGVGAYPNAYVPTLSDEEGYELFQRETGTELNAGIGGNYYDKEVITEYQKIAKQECLEILAANPTNAIRNFCLNTLQSFSIGYITKQPFLVHLLMSLTGLSVLIVLACFRQWFIVVGVLMGVCCFAPFYPPIPAYMFGNYLLLAFGATEILFSLFSKRKTEHQ